MSKNVGTIEYTIDAKTDKLLIADVPQFVPDDYVALPPEQVE
ncbi:TPA: hypothetical protein ACYZVL_001228 [Escherichia coli]